MMRRLLAGLRAVRCPLCREKTRRLAAHLNVDHFGEVEE